MSAERNAKLLLLLVVVIWGLNVVMVKYLSGYFSPTMLSAIRIGAAAALLFVVVWKQHGWVKPTRSEWVAITGIAMSGIWLHQITLSAGVQHTNASTASLILGLNPLATALLAYAVFREPLTPRKIFGVLLGFCGVTLVVFGDSWEKTAGLAFGIGEVLILVSMLAYVVSGMFIKKATLTMPVLVVTGYSHILATLVLTVTAITQEMVQPSGLAMPADWWVWFVMLFSGWVATALGSIWWNSGIKVIGAGRTAMFLNGMPMMSLVFSVLMLGETITWVHLVGFGAVFVAIYFGTTQGKASVESIPVSKRA